MSQHSSTASAAFRLKTSLTCLAVNELKYGNKKKSVFVKWVNITSHLFSHVWSYSGLKNSKVRTYNINVTREIKFYCTCVPEHSHHLGQKESHVCEKWAMTTKQIQKPWLKKSNFSVCPQLTDWQSLFISVSTSLWCLWEALLTESPMEITDLCVQVLWEILVFDQLTN